VAAVENSELQKGTTKGTYTVDVKSPASFGAESILELVACGITITDRL
jgi:hypothetical protein